jgi:hypothetical protein
LGPTVQELEGVIVEGTEIQSIQDVQHSELRETNRRSREIQRRGRSLRNKLAASVQNVFGVDSMALLAFGVNRACRSRGVADAGRKNRQAGNGARGAEDCEGCGRKDEGLISL